MSKKKEKQEEGGAEVKAKTIDLEKVFSKEFGEGIFVSAESFLEKPKMVIPLAPQIDIALNGGIPEGSTVICSGQPKTGKTTSCLSFASTCQRPEYGARDVYYMDIEGRLKAMNLKGINGLDLSKFFIIRSTPEKIMSAEDYLNAAAHILSTKQNSLLILDSSSALCASKEQINTVTGQTRNEGPKLLASFFRKVGNIIPVTNNILWIMQHLIADTSGHGAGYKEDGGQKAQYQADVKLRVQYSEPWKAGAAEDAKQIGQKINWRIITSALGGLPNQKSETYIRYGLGIDHYKEYIELATSLAIVSLDGSWYTYPTKDGELAKVQGGEKFCKLLIDESDTFEYIKGRVKEMMGT